jgi:hypothetical protein
MLIYSGLSAIPIEHLDQEPTPRLHAIAAERATTARFILDLVDAGSSRRHGLTGLHRPSSTRLGTVSAGLLPGLGITRPARLSGRSGPGG